MKHKGEDVKMCGIPPSLSLNVQSYGHAPSHSFAAGSTEPSLSFSPYLPRTDLLWNFQKGLEASLPPKRERTLTPPGCSCWKAGRGVRGGRGGRGREEGGGRTGEVVDVAVDDDPEVLGGLVLCDLGGGEGLGHFGGDGSEMSEWRKEVVCVRGMWLMVVMRQWVCGDEESWRRDAEARAALGAEWGSGLVSLGEAGP